MDEWALDWWATRSLYHSGICGQIMRTFTGHEWALSPYYFGGYGTATFVHYFSKIIASLNKRFNTLKVV